MAKLDKSRKFGLVFGTMGNARYEQGGRLFDNEGNELNADGMPLKGKGKPEASADGAGNAGSGNEGGAGGAEGAGGAGVAGASTGGDEVAELRAKGKALGIRNYHNLGVEKLKAAIAEAEKTAGSGSEGSSDDDQVSKSLEQ